ncbi:MAG: DUF2079 domain-containing protein [Ignavibacteria bacterium]|nr:DUF2079 domain-containing protein [Ignavibacteria bacterium]
MKTASWLFLFLPVFWLAGLHPNDIARILLAAVIILFLIPCTREYFKQSFEFTKSQNFVIIIFLFLYPTVISAHHVVRVYTGGEGINFAYFANVLNNFPEYNSLMLTLNKDIPYNHLLHHFSPIFFVPAFFTLAGIPGYLALIVSELLIITSLFFIFKKILSYSGYSKTVSYIFILLLLCNYSLRHSFSWSIEDEFFALPFIALSYYFFLKKNNIALILSLALCCTVKESMFLFALFFCVMVILSNLRSKVELNSTLKFFIPASAVFLLFFILYIWGQPIIFGKTYDHLSKASSLSSLLNFEMIKNKLYYLFTLLLPFLFFPLLNKKCLLLSIPAVPFILISMASGIKELYNPMDYYSAVPTVIFACAAVISLKDFNKDYLQKIGSGIVLILMCTAFLFGGWKPAKVIFESKNEVFFDESNFNSIPKQSTVLSSESLIPLLIGFKQVKSYDDDKLKSGEFDYFVIRQKEILPEKIDSALILDEKLSTKNLLVYKMRK